MRNFTDKTENFEEMPVYIAIKDFFDSFFVERNYQKMLSMMTDDFEGIGTVEESIVRDKNEFVISLKTELAIMTREISYELESISAKEVADDVWNVMATVGIDVVTGLGEKTEHFMHMMHSICLKQLRV